MVNLRLETAAFRVEVDPDFLVDLIQLGFLSKRQAAIASGAASASRAKIAARCA